MSRSLISSVKVIKSYDTLQFSRAVKCRTCKLRVVDLNPACDTTFVFLFVLVTT